MRLIALFFLIIYPASGAFAASQCGPVPNLQNKNLKRIIVSGATNLARTNAKGRLLQNAVKRDLTRIKRAYPKASQSEIGDYYFYTVCRILTKGKSGGRALSAPELGKLDAVSRVFGKNSNNQAVLKSLWMQSKNERKSALKKMEAKKSARNSVKQAEQSDSEKIAKTEQKSFKMKRQFQPHAMEKKSGSERKRMAAPPKLQSLDVSPPPGRPPVTTVQPPAGTVLRVPQPNGGQVKPPVAPNTQPSVARKSAPSAAPMREFNFEAAEAPAADKSDGCAELGVIGGDCTNFESVIKNLKEVPLAYNHPDSMYLGRRTQITLVLKTNSEDHTKELEGLQGEVKSGETKISRLMQAELIGEDFKIEPSGPQQRTITTLAPVKWTWFATPLEEGLNKNLNMELSAIIREGTRDLPPVAIRTFRTKINVDVKWWDLLIHRVKAFDPIYQLATAVGGVVTFILFVWRLGAWMRRRDSNSEAV